MRKLLLSIAGALLSASSLLAQSPAGAAETRLLRFPTTDGRSIVFSYTGQLYTVPLEGGIARRLTNAPGYAVFPRFSPDGTQLAFTAQYDGNTEVYVMPADGGTPKRLTYTATLGRDDLSDRMGPNNIVMAWKNMEPSVVFRSRMRAVDPFVGQLFSVGLDADLPKQLPVPMGGFMSYSPDDSKMAYNRIFREFRTWKQYRGGMADDIWIFDFKTGALEDITNNPAQDIIPMWAPNNKIYFLSDRDVRMNLFSYDLGSKQTVQYTHFRDFDIKFPSLGKGAIVFEEAGSIWRFDLQSGTSNRVPIVVKEDLAIERGGITKVSKFVTEVRPSPDGKRAVVVARGDLFTVPAKYGPTRNLTDTSGVHERGASWSPDGKWIAYVADATGETELYIRPQDGRGDAIQVTSGADTDYFAPEWSPDSKKLLWGDRAQRLRYVDIDSKAVTLIATNPSTEYTQYVWSPDSKWVAYTQPENYGESGIHLYSLADKRGYEASENWYEADSPRFSDDGKFLLFASSRDFHPIFSDTEFNHAYDNMQRVYLLALAKSVESPFKPESDEVGEAKAGEKPADANAGKPADSKEGKPGDAKGGKAADAKEGKPSDAEAAKPVSVVVDADGLTDRVVGLPIAPANYGSLRMIDDKVYYQRVQGAPADAAPDNATGPGPGTFALFDLKEKKETELGQVDAVEISADGKRVLVKQGSDYALIDLPSAKFEIKDKLDLSGLEMHLDRRAEWSEIYNESWRRMRDYFYAPNMQGIDWPAVRAKYAALVPSVGYRFDLTYLIGEMIGELHIGHTYVGGGDLPEAPRVKMGLLGAELSRDPASRAYRVDRILKGENWQEGTHSPLTEIGVNVKEGDYILAVDGKPVRDMANIYAALIDTVGKQVVLRVNSTPDDKGARDVTVIPIEDESPLYYYNWVSHNVDVVTKKTNGQVGYIHIPDMEFDGLDEFVKHFFPQLGKRALIIDDRGNGGGFVSPMIAERLRREIEHIEVARNGTSVPDPKDILVGPKVLLINQFSASDGDIFPHRFRTYHLGKIIGERTWGGVVGIRGFVPVATDGGFLSTPEFAPYSADGRQWIIEGHGVDPDIVVDNDPAKEFAGDDQQLDRAIDEIMADLKTASPTLPLPPPPPWPDRH
jgi:tricorn protease